MGEQNRRKPSGNLSIIRHPLFPAIVGLWFAALFGLGSVVVRPALIEQLVVSLGIDQVIPMAAPPLGTTFRILLALGMAVAGGAIGLLLARRIARSDGEAPARKRGVTPAGTASVAPETTSAMWPGMGFAARRRALTAEDTAHASDGFVERAPLPGSPGILNVTDFDLEGFEQVEDAKDNAETEASVDPFDTGNPFAETSSYAAPRLDSPPEQAQVFTPLSEEEQRAENALAQALTAIGKAPAPAPFAGPRLHEVATEEAPHPSDAGHLNNRLFETYSREITLRAEFAATSASVSPFGRRISAPVVETPCPGFELLSAMPDDEVMDNPQAAQTADPDDFASSWVNADPTEPFEVNAAAELQADDVVAPIAAAPTAAERIAGANLDTLSHVELLERLGVALERKRSEAEARAAAAKAATAAAEAAPPVMAAPGYTGLEYAPLPPASNQEFVPEQAESADPASSSAAEAAVWNVPAALRPVGFDHAEDDGDALPGYVPPRHIGVSAAEPDDSNEDAPDEDSQVLEEGYSSLLGLSRRATSRQQFIPLNEPAQDQAFPDPFEGEALKDQWQDDAGFSAPQPVPQGDAQETERALRAALATLQRMSGTA